MTRIVLKDCVGQLKAAVTTHHDETTFIRDLVTEDLKPGGAFGKFGVPGDTITVEDMNFALPGADKLERLSIASYLPYEKGVYFPEKAEAANISAGAERQRHY